MRVCLVCPYSWTSPGGVQSHVRGLAGALRERGWDAPIVTPADGPVDDPTVTVVGATVPVHDNASVVPIALAPSAAWRTLAAIRAMRPDVVHVHEPLIPWVSLAALFAGAPLVGTFHRYAETPGWYRVFRPLARALAARLDVRIAVSEAARRHVAAACPGAYDVIPNGIRAGPDPFGPGVAPPRAGRRVAFVGRPDPRKGLPVLFDALGRLPGPVVLDLIGVSAAELRRAGCRPPGGACRVEAHGRVSDARRDALLRRADVFCSPALSGESFGIVLAEAMAAGVPVVASDVGGMAELVGDAAGLVVPPGDAGALAGALARLLARPADRAAAGRAGRARALALDWSTVVERVVARYDDARRRRARGPAGRGGGARWRPGIACSASGTSRPAPG